MKTCLLLLLSILVISIRAQQPYEMTHYGGSDDHNDGALEYPFCYNGVHGYDGLKTPTTDYYAAVRKDDNEKYCLKHAVIIGVDPDKVEREYLGNMVKVHIVDTCRECPSSHLDVGPKAFDYLSEHTKGTQKIMWLVFDSKGNAIEEPIYDDDSTADFVKKFYKSKGLTLSSYVKKFKYAAKEMIKSGKTKYNIEDAKEPVVPKTTKVVVAQPTSIIAPALNSTKNAIPVNNSTVIKAANITIGTGTKELPNPAAKVTENKENNNKKEEKEDEEAGGSVGVGVTSSVATAGVATALGLLYLKKKKPSKYEELKSKFPETFDNIKRSVSRSATSIKRGFNKSIRRTPSGSINNVSRHGQHDNDMINNSRMMPDYMYGDDGIIRYQLYDQSM